MLTICVQGQNKQAVIKDKNVLPCVDFQNKELNGWIYESCYQDDVKEQIKISFMVKKKKENNLTSVGLSGTVRPSPSRTSPWPMLGAHRRRDNVDGGARGGRSCGGRA